SPGLRASACEPRGDSRAPNDITRTRWRSEPSGAVGGAVARGSVVAGFAGAQVAAPTRAVAARGDVEERRGVAVRVRARAHRCGVAGKCVDGGDDRRGHAGATEDEPAAHVERVVHGDAGA